MRLPAELPTESVTAIIDTREQTPLDLRPLQTIAGTLVTGDYSVVGLEHFVAIERKSLSDLISCVGCERERFDREVQRLLAYPVRVLVVEACWVDVEQHRWRSNVTPTAVQGSLLGWIAMGLPVVMAGDHERGGGSLVAFCTRRPADDGAKRGRLWLAWWSRRKWRSEYDSAKHDYRR